MFITRIRFGLISVLRLMGRLYCSDIQICCEKNVSTVAGSFYYFLLKITLQIKNFANHPVYSQTTRAVMQP